MTPVDVLFIATVMIHLVIMGVWWSGGSMLSLSRKAACHWTLSALALGISMLGVLLAASTGSVRWQAVAAGSALAGFVALRRGLQWFMRARRSEREHVICLLLALAVATTAALPPLGAQACAGIGALTVTGLTWRTARECRLVLRHEFGAAAPWVVIVPVAAAGLIVAVQGLHALGNAAAGRLAPYTSNGGTIALIFAFHLLHIGVTFGLGYVVVMRLVRKLQHLSQHDGLTGLLNRRAMEYLLDREAHRLQRFGGSYAVLLVDIDHFKRVNDRLGHAAGDAVLSAVARTLGEQAREVDRVARFGGEEFCVLLPQAGTEGALLAAERLREAVRRTPVAWSDDTVAITISAGVAVAADAAETPAQVLQRADRALYAAKAQGRDRVILADEAGMPASDGFSGCAAA